VRKKQDPEPSAGVVDGRSVKAQAREQVSAVTTEERRSRAGGGLLRALWLQDAGPTIMVSAVEFLSTSFYNYSALQPTIDLNVCLMKRRLL
jgi:hypothetical protein